MSSDFREKIKSIRGSVVAIGFSPEPNKITITGSGFCVSDDGKILTAAHIYNQTPPQFQSSLLAMAMVKQEADGREENATFPASFVKKEDKDDVALLQIPDYQKTLMKPLALGDSEKVEVGQDVYFIGFPYAAQLMKQGLGITLIANRGIVSSVKRDGQDPTHPRNLLIIDAISNPGNSGCPLFDVETNTVVGIMSMAFRTKSQVQKYNDLDIREPMHIGGGRPINLAKKLL